MSKSDQIPRHSRWEAPGCIPSTLEPLEPPEGRYKPQETNMEPFKRITDDTDLEYEEFEPDDGPCPACGKWTDGMSEYCPHCGVNQLGVD